MTSFIDYFTGKWKLSREIFIAQKLYATGVGEASFVAQNNFERIYNESGKTLVVDTQTSIPFRRSFLYHFDNNLVSVFFNDGFDQGKLYQDYRHEKSTDQLVATCQHLCVADNYNGFYQLINQQQFYLETRIVGPKKNFDIQTSFYRL